MTIAEAIRLCDAIEDAETRYRHADGNDNSLTLCGIDLDAYVGVPMLACNCGHPDCTKQVNCPACLSILHERIN